MTDEQHLSQVLVKANLDAYRGKYGNDEKYLRYVNRIQAIALDHTSEADVCGSIQDLLYDWGRMGRVLGRSEYFGWQETLATVLRENSRDLLALRGLDLAKVDLAEYLEKVCGLYSVVVPVVGPIGAAKVLHALCPAFFPLWDNAIAEGMRAEYYTKDPVAYEAFSAFDYFEFMKAIQRALREHGDSGVPMRHRRERAS